MALCGLPVQPFVPLGASECIVFTAAGPLGSRDADADPPVRKSVTSSCGGRHDRHPVVVRSRFKHCQDTPLIAGNGAKLKVKRAAVRFLGVLPGCLGRPTMVGHTKEQSPGGGDYGVSFNV